MTINNPEEYCRNLWDWSILDGCFGETKIKPTDVDGEIFVSGIHTSEVERNGLFLRLETKSNGASIPTGQQIMFNSLINTGVFTVIIIWGNSGDPRKIRLITRYIDREYSNANIEILRDIVKRWFHYANKVWWDE